MSDKSDTVIIKFQRGKEGNTSYYQLIYNEQGFSAINFGLKGALKSFYMRDIQG